MLTSAVVDFVDMSLRDVCATPHGHDDISAPTPDDYPYGPFGEKQRGRYVDSSDQVVRELS